MNIVTPLTKIDNFEPLAEAGADEFYCGYIPFEWLQNYNMTTPINRREWFLTDCNICNFSDMKVLSRMSEHYKIPIKITLNAHYYVKEQYEKLADIVKRLMSIGINTFIIADPALILYLFEHNINCAIHLSGEAEMFNQLSMKIYEQFEIKRYVFPRKILFRDMKEVINSNQRAGVEYEAFYLNSFCQFSAGFCNSVHCDKIPTTCWLKYNMVPRTLKDSAYCEKIKKQYTEHAVGPEKHKYDKFAMTGCGVCKIKELEDIGVDYLKVVGRGHSLDSLVSDLTIVKEIMQQAKTDGPAFSHEKIKSEYFGNDCPIRCYYPKPII